MKFFSKHWRITIIIVAAISAGCFVLEHFAGFNPVSSAVNTVMAPIKQGCSYIAYKFVNVRDFIWDMRAYKEDNERLEAENIKLKQEVRDVSSYKEENERLEAMLKLKDSSENYTYVAASVISYSQTGWYKVIEINKGAINGISVGSAVVTPEGLVGRVTEVGPNNAVISTILDKSSVIGIKISRTGGTGLVEGDEELAKDLMCKLSFLDRNTPIIVGDVIETSGSGGAYPSGVVIGTVINISANSAGTLNYAKIEPAVDFADLNYVMVITGNK